jgi:SAM-dependent methyltransferase
MEGQTLYEERLIKELSDYTGKSPWLCEQRTKFATLELAFLWDQYKNDPLKYYKETDLYIFDLTMYHIHLEKRGVHAWFEEQIRKYDWKQILDFGGGTGEYTILAEQNGVKTTFVEMGKTLEYARWRFTRYNVHPNEEDSNEDGSFDLNKKYDCIVVMDVLEHLPDPEPMIKKLAECTSFIICNPSEIKYSEIYPQHISHVDLTPYFTNVEKYLWKRK